MRVVPRVPWPVPLVGRVFCYAQQAGIRDQTRRSRGRAASGQVRGGKSMVSTVRPSGSLETETIIARHFPGARRVRHHGRACYGQSISGSELVVAFMQFVGVDVIFGVPGGASLPLSDALTYGHVEGALRYVLTGHEQGAAFEAEGYA